MKKFLFFSFLICGLSTISLAQTSVYFCSTNGAYGFCYGNNNVSNCAYNNCINYGGKTPYSILSVNSKGYGAIAVGNNSQGAQVVGAAAGYANLKDAKNRAKQECINRGGQNVYISDTFNDR